MPHIIKRRMTRKGILFSLLATSGMCAMPALATSSVAEAGVAAKETASSQRGAQQVHIRIAIGSMNMTATLEDNPTAREFVALLPLTLTLRDFSGAEKVSGALPKRLSEERAPATDAGDVGDIAYYAPWGNIAFYRGRGPVAPGVIKIARITSGIDALKQPGEVRVTISRANQVK